MRVTLRHPHRFSYTSRTEIDEATLLKWLPQMLDALPEGASLTIKNTSRKESLKQQLKKVKP